jgi:hypothetical protein
MQEVHKTHAFMGYYHHESSQGYIRESPKKYQRYDLEQVSQTLGIATHEQNMVVVSDIPWDTIPADVFWNDSEIQFSTTPKETTPTRYLVEDTNQEWYNQMARNTTIHNQEEIAES